MKFQNKLFISFSFIFSVVSFLPLAAKAAESCEVTSQLDTAAYAYMAANSMILPGEEGPIGGPASPVSSKWTLVETHLVDGQCLLLMDRCTVNTIDKATYCERQGVEVLAYLNGKVTHFERALKLAKSVRVAIGQGVVKNGDSGALIDSNDNYYIELTGQSAIDAWKVIKLQLMNAGLTADISAKNVRTENFKLRGEPDGKLSFDPTPNRNWKLKNSLWSLRRNSTPEIMDVYAEQIDGDFEGYFSGSSGAVGPWQGFVIKYFESSTNAWVETGIRKKLREVSQSPGNISNGGF